ncbi:MAG TPA: hypothetical protein VK858_12775 [Longimicrobiales bacterium]|nr:hypothetical protein [Longimicrobiales bacterium]
MIATAALVAAAATLGAPIQVAGQTSLSPEPILSLAPEPGFEFYQVRGLILPESGGVAVANDGSGQILWFDASGHRVDVLGGPGEGPGEFQALSDLLSCGTEVIAWDGVADRVTVYRDRELVRDFRVPLLDGQVPEQVSCSADSLVFLYRLYDPPSEMGPYRPRVAIHAFGFDGTHLGHVATVPGTERYRHETGDGPRVFGAVTRVAVHDGRTVVGTGDEDPADLAGSVTFALPGSEEPITEEQLSAQQSRELARVEARYPSAAPALRRNQAVYDYPDLFPRHTRMFFDDGGRLWVRRFLRPLDRQERWVIFDPAGSVLATVQAPEGLAVMAVRGDRVAGVWKDELDVEHVLVYGLRGVGGGNR